MFYVYNMAVFANFVNSLCSYIYTIKYNKMSCICSLVLRRYIHLYQQHPLGLRQVCLVGEVSVTFCTTLTITHS